MIRNKLAAGRKELQEAKEHNEKQYSKRDENDLQKQMLS